MNNELLEMVDLIEANFTLGYIYENGYGLSKNYDKAKKYYLKAANKNSSISQYFLSLLLYNHFKNYKDAFYWCERASINSFHPSYSTLAYFFEKGIGVNQDLKKAINWYKKAAEGNDSKAASKIATIYFKLKDYSNSLKWFTKASDLGDAFASRYLSIIYSQETEFFKRNELDYKKSKSYSDLATELSLKEMEELKNKAEMINYSDFSKEEMLGLLKQYETLLDEYDHPPPNKILEKIVILKENIKKIESSSSE